MTNIKEKSVVEAQITGITTYGLFVSLEDNYVGLIHISEVSNNYISDLEEQYKIGDIIKVKVIEVDEEKLQVKLSIKKLLPKVKVSRKKIEESTNGFNALKDNMPIWIEDKMKELSNIQ